ncbi:MAG: SlyX family protein [Gammaproteobacteria bacterium]|nr:SlyX family protein [Gammaproteobacteria bacterium]
MDEHRERIELKIAWLEQALQELGDVVYRQQREIDDLRQRLRATENQLDTLRSAGGPRRADDERPPHY